MVIGGVLFRQLESEGARLSMATFSSTLHDVRQGRVTEELEQELGPRLLLHDDSDTESESDSDSSEGSIDGGFMHADHHHHQRTHSQVLRAAAKWLLEAKEPLDLHHLVGAGPTTTAPVVSLPPAAP